MRRKTSAACVSGLLGIIGAQRQRRIGRRPGFGQPDGLVVEAELFQGGGQARPAQGERFPAGIVVVVHDVEPVLAAAGDDAGKPGFER
jgi:hypothetical protein